MKVFKFGGASVKDAAGVKNVQNVLEKTGNGPKVIVISAMGKTTNALEIVIKDYLFEKEIPKSLEAVEETHFEILNELFEDTKAQVFTKVNTLFTELKNFLQHNKSEQYDFVYDQVICYGELVSTTIVSEYLNSQNVNTNWVDAREFIKTDSVYRDAGVNWEETQEAIQRNLNLNKINITQGFIGSDPNNFTTTLGREGSDYTAAIFAYCLNAENVTIWKDVPGVLNADPRVFKDPELLQHISYEEAMELSHFGAKVLYPPTIQPVLSKGISIVIKNTFSPEEKGTLITKSKNEKGKTVRGISHIGNIALLSLEGPGMVGIPGISKRFFEVLSQADISVVLITQASSEHSGYDPGPSTELADPACCASP